MRYLATTVVVTAMIISAACDRSAAPAEPAGLSVSPPAEPAIGTQATQASTPAFTDRIWWRTDQGSAPGAMQVFLGNGTLISDSCFEGYRLSNWRQDGDGAAWDEDGVEIRARVASIDGEALVLQVRLAGGQEDQHFSAASVPYVCPDMPR